MLTSVAHLIYFAVAPLLPQVSPKILRVNSGMIKYNIVRLIQVVSQFVFKPVCP